MSLITCPECGKEISDKALTCIHCGYPIKKEETFHTTKKFVYMCMGECLSNPFKEFDEYKGDVQVCPDCGSRLEYYETETIDNDTDLVVEHFIAEESKKNTHNAHLSNQPKCPTCGSTNVQKITGFERGISVATLGLFSKKINKSFKCNKCGYTW